VILVEVKGVENHEVARVVVKINEAERTWAKLFVVSCALAAIIGILMVLL